MVSELEEREAFIQAEVKSALWANMTISTPHLPETLLQGLCLNLTDLIRRLSF